MGLDLFTTKTEYYVDRYDMMMTQNPSWNPNGDNGIVDSIGRTVDAYFAYDHLRFIYAVRKCYRYKNGYLQQYLQAYRHPSIAVNDLKGGIYNDMSRDHIIYSLIIFKASNDPYLYYLSKNLRWKISDRYWFTPEVWLWMKGITGNKLAMFLYYLLDIIILFIAIKWNKFIYFVAGFQPESNQNDFKKVQNSDKPKSKVFFRKLLYPIYTLYQKAFMMYVSDNCYGKKKIKQICLKGIDKENYLLRIMFGDKTVTEEQVNSYKPMTGWRWSGYLESNLNDRDMNIITDPVKLEANVLDVDLLQKMYKLRNRF